MRGGDNQGAGALSVLLSRGFRPFFLCAALWAAIALALWLAMLTTGLALPTRFEPLEWHINEMLFGFVLATMAGFLLTAIPEWTGREPVYLERCAGSGSWGGSTRCSAPSFPCGWR